jgi:hypothetical protein
VGLPKEPIQRSLGSDKDACEGEGRYWQRESEVTLNGVRLSMKKVKKGIQRYDYDVLLRLPLDEGMVS